MYINPFLAGVLTVITLELVAFVGFVFYCAVETVNSRRK